MSIRTRRVGNEIQKIISELLESGTIHDPRLSGLITITGVDVSPDLRAARVYYSCYGNDEDKESSEKAFKSASGYIQSDVGKRLGIKFTPHLTFVFDPSIEYGDQLERIIGELADE